MDVHVALVVTYPELGRVAHERHAKSIVTQAYFLGLSKRVCVHHDQLLALGHKVQSVVTESCVEDLGIWELS